MGNDARVVVFGARSRVGRVAVPRLLAAGRIVRAVTRQPAALGEQARLGAEVVAGDLRDPESVVRACAGAASVIAATHAVPGTRGNDPPIVDRDGNHRLVDTARAAGVRRFVFISAAGASISHPVDFFRYKVQTEDRLRASGMEYTILRGWLFMEFWAALIGEPLARGGKAKILGRGENPINFVSCEDVAGYAVAAVDDGRMRNRTIEVGGPENLTMLDVANRYARILGCTATLSRMPTAAMRVLGSIGNVVHPPLARMMRAGVLLDTRPQTFDMSATAHEFGIPMTALDDVIRRHVAATRTPVGNRTPTMSSSAG